MEKTYKDLVTELAKHKLPVGSKINAIKLQELVDINADGSWEMDECGIVDYPIAAKLLHQMVRYFEKRRTENGA